MSAGDRLSAAVLGAVAFAAFASTAYPTITWWDSSNYSAAAVTLGITTPPGSLLLTLAGWLVTRPPWPIAPAYVLNLFAGALAAVTTALVFLLALRLLRHGSTEADDARGAWRTAETVGAAFGALAFAFAHTPWVYAVQFTPYMLTAVFTALILWNMLRWWEDAGSGAGLRRLVLLGLLFGLDVSVHRTNLLLLPALFVWILLRHPATLRDARAWLSGVAGTALGLSLHVAILPLAARQPAMNAGDPETWRRFYDYVSLAQYGGGFLVQFYPRHAPLWSVQFGDFARAFAANFASGRGWMLVPGALPALLGVAGGVAIARRQRRLALALAALVVVHAATTVLYFNIPGGFFRPFDRHYLPVFTSFAVLVAAGAGWAARALVRAWRFVPVRAAPALGLVLAVVPASQFARNRSDADGSRRFFAMDFATNLLRGLPPDAILFTAGDNDTWPLLYAQLAEQVRPDVDVVNLSLANTDWYLRQIAARDAAFPLRPGDVSREVTRAWSDTTVALAVEGTPADFDLPEGTFLGDSIAVRAPPTLGGRAVLRQDLALLQLLAANRWKRPVTVAVTASVGAAEWFAHWRRLDGLFWRIVPSPDPPPSEELLRGNLLGTYRYRGYADPRVPLDDVARMIGGRYVDAFMALARAESGAGDLAACRDTRERMRNVLPLSRLAPDADTRSTIAALCETSARSGR